MLEDIFAPNPSGDKYRRVADERAGAWSILVGIAANRSLLSGGQLDVASVLVGLEVSGAFLVAWTHFFDQALVIRGGKPS